MVSEVASLVCPNCHGTLTWDAQSGRCLACAAVYPIREHVVDFSPDWHYDHFTPTDCLSDEHLQGLAFEIDGSRRRIADFYSPLIRTSQPAARRVLDCGCGNGISVETLAEFGFDAWGNDLSELRAWQWRERANPRRLVLASGLRLPFPTNFFDVVISSGVVEHIGVTESAIPRYTVTVHPDRDEQRIAFLRELGRVLAPDGVLFVDCPNGAFPIDFWHGNIPGRPRLHSLREGFLPRYGELRRLAHKAMPGAVVNALSPHQRLQFKQANRHTYTRLIAPAAKMLFRVMRKWPFRWLARTFINPFLVICIRRIGTAAHARSATSVSAENAHPTVHRGGRRPQRRKPNRWFRRIL